MENAINQTIIHGKSPSTIKRTKYLKKIESSIVHVKPSAHQVSRPKSKNIGAKINQTHLN